MALRSQQFRVLYRDSLRRLVDLELLSSQGDVTKLFGQFAALLCAFSFVLTIYLIPRYAFSTLSPNKLALAASGDQEFLVATTMAVVGMFAVVAWDSVFPDRRDIAILGPLPVHIRTMFRAKVAAIATGLAISVAAINVVTGLTYPFVSIAPGSGSVGILRTFAAYWITMLAAATFVFSALLAVQGLAAQLLSYRLFQRVSNFLQIGAFFAVLAVYFLTPGSSELSITSPENRSLIAWFPSFWFLGLFQELNGSVHPVFAPLAAEALWSLSIALTIAFVTYTLSYLRNVRRIFEQPDIVPADRSRPAGRHAAAVLSKIFQKPLERAIFQFTARTLARSRQHRTILAVYGGIGLAISLTYAKILLYGDSRLYASMRQYITVPHWYRPNVPLMAAGFVTIFFAIIGTRAVFSLPAALKANWVFRITAVHSPKAYFRAVRKSLYWLAFLPIWIALAIVYFSIWPPLPVIAHLVVLALASVILIERSLYEFQKLPFTCSYLPGKSGLNQRLAIFGMLFLFLTSIGTRIELWTLESASRYLVLFAILGAAALRARARWANFASATYHRLQFEDVERAEVSPLDLRRDGAWGMERYVDVANPEPERPLGERIRSACFKAAVVSLVVITLSTSWEQFAQWRHRVNVPRIGRAVDIGGRSLNLFCSGDRGPTVIFESGAGGPGYWWVAVQREVAKFSRACWYDRAGYGWSDSAPYPHPATAIADDLHRLLHAASVPPPYVLVGASFGGLCVRVFNGLYPEEVAGMVLVDSSHFDENDSIPPGGESASSPSFLYAQSVFAQAMRQIGLLRIFMDSGLGTPPKGVTQEEWRIMSSFEPRTLAENAKELFGESAKQARASSDMGDRPLIVLTAGLPNREVHDPIEARAAIARQENWIWIQRQLAAHSTRGKQIVLPNSHHCIQCDDPEAVIGAIRDVVHDAR